MKRFQKKVRMRGTGTYDPETRKFGFEPFNEAPSTQQDVKTCTGGGKCWTTTGSDPSKMISLKCKASSPDPYSDLASQFIQLTKDMKPEQPLQLPDTQRLVSESGLECWLDSSKNELTFTGTIDLVRHYRDWQAEVLRQLQLVVRRMPGCDKFNKVINQIKKEGGKENV